MGVIKPMFAFGIGYYIGCYYHPFIKKIMKENMESKESIISITKNNIKIFGINIVSFSEIKEK
jgi:hypothetical protein